MANLDVLNLNGTRYDLTDTGARSIFAPIESATSTRAYAKDEYLVYNGTLYKTLTAITVGATLTVGTNIEQTRVGDEITDLYSLIDTHTREITQEEYDQLSTEQKNDGTMYMITDGDAGEFDLVEMTQNDYDLLPPDQRNENTLYMITDGDPQATAEDVVYDNTSSGLLAMDVQSAIDENVSTISNILGDFGTVQTTSVATKNYSVGDYLVLNNQFYKVTNTIANGESIVIGTNVEATNVGAEVSQLNSKMPGINTEIRNSTTLPYTPTQDCWVCAYCTGSNATPLHLYIDGKAITTSVGMALSYVFPLKAGQKLTKDASLTVHQIIYYSIQY